jgi:hypothetical protein
VTANTPPASHPACLSDEALLRACTLRTGRASGPGGQHRNKTETEVTLIHDPTGLTGRASERRSQAENKAVALTRLRLVLAIEVRTPALESPSALWLSRRRGTTIACNPAHRDFPALLAEIFDVLVEVHYDAKAAASHFGVSPTQLIRLVAEHPAALVFWNKEREWRGLGALRGGG